MIIITYNLCAMIYISAISLVEGKVPGARRGIFLQRVFCVPFLSSFYSLFWGTRNNTNKQAVCGIPSMATQFSNEDSFPFDTRIVGCSLIAVSTVLCFTFWSRSWVSRNSNRGVRKWDETLVCLMSACTKTMCMLVLSSKMNEEVL